MNVAIGSLSVALGLAYITLGVLATPEVIEGHKTLGVSRFGIGFALMASSCGPHHLVHGHHVLLGVDAGRELAMAILLGTPTAVVFLTLRIEAMLDGRGDRFIAGSPPWLVATPIIFLIAAGVVIGNAADRADGSFDIRSPDVLANLFVTVTYSLVGWPLLRTQFRRRIEAGGWSASGLTLAAIFPTCALMHLTYAIVDAGDAHTTVVDLWGVPASLYFLWVVRALYHDAIVDWNRRPIVGVTRPARRSSPWESSRS